MARTTLITGGGRSGKSIYALHAAERYEHRAFLATAVALDDEMKERIRNHQAQRSDTFLTIEEPYDLAGALSTMPEKIEVAVVDCLTVWLGNLFHKHGQETGTFPEVETFMKLLESPPCDLILVTNEVGMGIIPDNALAREFRDTSGMLNKNVAALADDVFLLISGLPLPVKQGAQKNIPTMNTTKTIKMMR